MKGQLLSNTRTGRDLPASGVLLLITALAGGGLALAANPQPTPHGPVSPLQVRYQLDTPGGGEIFPALTSGDPAQYWPVATLTTVNGSTRPVVEMVSAQIADWSRKSVETVQLEPNERRTIRLNPELLPKAFQNGEIRPATLEVRASILGTAVQYSQTRSVYLHAASDFYWGSDLSNAQFISRWVTPHDPAVLQLVAAVRNYVTRGRLAGYGLPGGSPAAVAAQVENEARGVFAAMQHRGVSYVDSASVYGHFTTLTERVRLPRETLSTNSANCIDLSVAFASAMENLGMQPVIVVVPGHAFTGVRLARGSPRILYLDLTVMPDGTFDAAVQRAQNWLQKTPEAQLRVIDIATARTHQIYPMAAVEP